MGTHNIETRYKELQEAIEQLVLDLAVALKEKKEIDLEDSAPMTLKKQQFASRIDIPISTWYQYHFNYRIDQDYDAIKYLQDTGKFKINLQEYIEKNDLREEYDSRISE